MKTYQAGVQTRQVFSIEIPLTSEEKYKLRKTKREIELITRAIDTIKDLDRRLKQYES